MTTRADTSFRRWLLWALLVIIVAPMYSQTSSDRPRAREAGVIVGSLPPGPLNAITDVAGVRVGHTTVREGGAIRTGVTAIVPHGGNVFEDRVPAAIYVGNGFGKVLGVTQVRELGELETPILLTSTLSVWQAADALVAWLLAQPGMEEVRSINPVVGETNDGFLNDIRARAIRPEHVVRALERAASGAVEEGAVGAGTGTVAFGWKGGIGTSSRQLPATRGGYLVGVIVQSNFGGELTINGVRVGRELGERASKREAKGADAPGSRRSRDIPAGLARTGSNLANGSGDYVIAFSTAPECRRPRGKSMHQAAELSNDAMTPLFQAVAEATEEAIYNSLFRAMTTRGFKGTVEALPVERALEMLQRSGVLRGKAASPSKTK